MNTTVNGLWIQGELGALEQLTIKSFISCGFEFHLWTYASECINAPDGTIVRNAGEIIPDNMIFSYKNTNIHGHGKGSFAGFSDIFRYKLLYEYGGIWTDMDITCLKPFNITEAYFFRYHHKAGAVGNFIKCPPKSALMLRCYERSIAEINSGNTNWMLPIQILNDGIKEYGLTAYIHKISNNDSFPEVARLLSCSVKIPEDWKIIHWMNEELRRMKISKEQCLPDSQLKVLYSHFQIPHNTYRGVDILKNKILLSRYYYLLQNIRSTLRWYVLPH